MSEYQVGATTPPFHPWCRGCTAPYFEDMKDIGARAARDDKGKEYTVPADMTYGEWSKQAFKNPAVSNENAQKAFTSETNRVIIHAEDIQIGRSIGARALNYDIYDPSEDDYFHFVEGTSIQNVEVFAGRGTKKALHEGVAEGLTREFGGRVENWQHAKGHGILDYYGEERKAEVHWFQEKSVGKVKFKVKRWDE